MKVVIYGECPKCVIIAKKLDDKSIIYNKITDRDAIISKSAELGVRLLPIIIVDGEYKGYMEMIKWINEA